MFTPCSPSLFCSFWRLPRPFLAYRSNTERSFLQHATSSRCLCTRAFPSCQETYFPAIWSSDRASFLDSWSSSACTLTMQPRSGLFTLQNDRRVSDLAILDQHSDDGDSSDSGTSTIDANWVPLIGIWCSKPSTLVELTSLWHSPWIRRSPFTAPHRTNLLQAY